MDLQSAQSLYLDLLKKSLLGLIYQDSPVATFLGAIPDLVPKEEFNPALRAIGDDWPSQAHTMIGAKRMDNLQECTERILANGVPGDLVETGVWRGGATIFMRGLLRAYDVTDRVVWVVDSFEGFPPPDPVSYPADQGKFLNGLNQILAVSITEVNENFARYGLLDDQVRFLAGWFRDTLPTAPIEQLAILRLDGDLYESTILALEHLYPKLSVGGYVIIDDYNLEPCSQAVTHFRMTHAVVEEIQTIAGSGVFWRREV